MFGFMAEVEEVEGSWEFVVDEMQEDVGSMKFTFEMQKSLWMIQISEIYSIDDAQTLIEIMGMEGLVIKIGAERNVESVIGALLVGIP